MSERSEALLLLAQAMLNLAIIAQKVAETPAQRQKLQQLIDTLDAWLVNLSPPSP